MKIISDNCRLQQLTNIFNLHRVFSFYNQATTLTSICNVNEWIEELEYFLLAEFGDVDAARKNAAPMTGIGIERKAVIRNMPAWEKGTYAHLVTALKEHYQPSQYLISVCIVRDMVSFKTQNFIVRLRA
jgi:hypothetical protein